MYKILFWSVGGIMAVLIGIMIFGSGRDVSLSSTPSRHPKVIVAPPQSFSPKAISFTVNKIWDYPFQQPRALAIDASDNVYVSESYQGPGSRSRILKFTHDGTLLGWWGKGTSISGWHSASSAEENVGNGNNPGEFNYIFKIAFDADQNMYVIDRGKYYGGGAWHVGGVERIQRFDRDGNFTGWIGGSEPGWHTALDAFTATVSSPILDDASCLIPHDNELIVGSWNKNRVDVFDKTSGNRLRWLGKDEQSTYGWHTSGTSVAAPYWGTEVGTFNGVIDCRMHGSELFVVSYASNPVVAIFDYASGKYLRGLSHNDGHKPQEIIVDAKGNLIFSDNYEGSIKFMSPELQLKTKMQLGPGGDYFGVADFAFDSEGTLFFIEQQKERLYQITLAP